MKRFSVVLAICLLAAGSTMAAPSVTIGRVADTYPLSPLSGEFKLTPNAELAAVIGSGSFQSFCLEAYESISADNSTYVAYVSDEAILGGDNLGDPGVIGDPISPETAYLYTQFRAGTLDGYDFDGDTRAGSALALQVAFWYLEDEVGYQDKNAFSALTKTFIADAEGSDWTTIGDVVVLNLEEGGNAKISRQDMLGLVTIPAPGAVLLSSIGLGLIGWLKRRRAM